MTANTYPYALPPLPYSYDALVPYIDAETLRYHHDKHFASYINGLNRALKPYPALQRLPLEVLLASPSRLPAASRTAILHNGGGVYNHALYFDNLSPPDSGDHMPQGRLMAAIERSFGSFDGLKKAMNKQAGEVFGSGWTALAISPRHGLQIVSLANQDTLIPAKMTPIIMIDVWEHAYYLEYKNRRAEYLEKIWNVLSFGAF